MMLPGEEASKTLKEWAEKHGLFLRITNEGHHWSFYREGKILFEWWPSTGKMVIKKQWKENIRVPDAYQLISMAKHTRLIPKE